MYDLRVTKDGVWMIQKHNGGALRGTLRQVMSYCQFYLGFDVKELDLALDEMIKQGHDGAHFGVMQGFIFTFDSKDRPLVRDMEIHGVH